MTDIRNNRGHSRKLKIGVGGQPLVSHALWCCSIYFALLLWQQEFEIWSELSSAMIMSAAKLAEWGRTTAYKFPSKGHIGTEHKFTFSGRISPSRCRRNGVLEANVRCREPARPKIRSHCLPGVSFEERTSESFRNWRMGAEGMPGA